MAHLRPTSEWRRPWTALVVALLAFAGARPPAIAAQTLDGIVRGRVVEAEGGAPVVGVQIVVTGTRVGAITNNDGAFVVRSVPTGLQSLRFARIGYAPQSVSVTVTASGDATVNVKMKKSVAQLDAVITTATGDQSRREFGNAVSTVQATEVAGRAPVTSVNEMLQARVPGLQVIQGSGQTGATSSIRIRGTSSLSLSNEPLIIVDGIRIDNSATPGNFNTFRMNRFSSFNADDIESVDVIKGPSASAMYGSAAANGVLVIKTKRGSAGQTRWNTYVEMGKVQQPAEFFPNYRAWGRNVTNGVPGTAAVLCRIADQSLGRCVRDSLTTFNPLMNPETTPFATKPRYLYGAQVAGGTGQVKYFVSAEREDETGPYQMPASEISRLTTLRGAAPTNQQIEPNTLRQTSLRGNFSLPLGEKADLSVASAYSDRTVSSVFDGGFFAGLSFQSYFAPGFKTATNGTSAQFMGDIFSVAQSVREQRTITSATATWQARSWLSTRAVTGVDQTSGYSYRFARFNEGTITGWGPPGQTGGKDANRNSFSRYSVDLSAIASYALTSSLGTKTTIGGQWFRDAQYQTVVQGYTLPPGAQTPNSASIRTSSEFTSENKTVAAYVAEDLSWRDRVYLNGSVRVEDNSAFGSTASNILFPRVALSYVVSEESWFPSLPGVSNMRLRTSWGRAANLPGTTAALQFLTAGTAPINGVEVGTLRLAAIGNADLRPEVTTEYEYGTDIGLLDGRINVELTAFSKQSKDALFNNPLPPSLGAGGNQWQNLAKMSNKGVEFSLSGKVLSGRRLSWQSQINGSHINNKILDAGKAQLAVTQGARNVVGYPAFALWARPIKSFADKNGDGILTESEIVVGDTAEYRGPTLPRWESGISNTVGLFNDALRVTALFDYRGGFVNQWGFENQRCGGGNCRAVSDPTAPLSDQAAAVATTSAALGNTVWGFFRDNDFLRFRELSVSYDVPENVAKKYLRSRSFSVSLSGRNLGVWTKYPGIDPETNSSVSDVGNGGNNDFFAAPLLRYYIVRFNVGF